ncbi:putative calcium/proton exchanger, sodium/calcium exchanger membrane region [Septoria linicola]|nr:putative calcium/proton exchanger, sodium/calcium exchanger membrane region [Septoria linicola]
MAPNYDRPNHGISWNQSRARHFKRKDIRPADVDNVGAGTGDAAQDEKQMGAANGRSSGSSQLPMYNADGHRVNHAGHKVTPGIQPDGESGRSWFSPLHFFKIIWVSSCTASKWTNVLWPFTIAAMVLHFVHGPELWIFITAFIGMIPAANLVGFAGQELARKIPKVAGVLLETTFGSIVEIILFIVLLVNGRNQEGGNVQIIRAAILGSILANLLMCLGLCFFVGGIFHPQQTFHEAISEVGSNLMLVAGFGLVIPTIYYFSLEARATNEGTLAEITYNTTKLSRATAIILLIAFCVYVWFQARSHHGLYEDILEADEERDHDRHKDLVKPKLTLTESIIALLIALTFVSFMAIFLVQEIHYMVVERGIPDAFIGLILIPLVEKAAEHITAIDEAYDNQMNFALSHVLGASIQTALLNAPIVILVGWGIGVTNMSLNFESFDAIVLILAIIVVGNFLRDEKSDYLEGALCVMVYALIAVSAFYYPNPEGTMPASGEGAEAAHRLMFS